MHRLEEVSVTDNEPVVPMLVRLVDRDGDVIGAQKHGLRMADLEPHTGSAEALAAFVQDTLMPQVAKATLQAFLSQVPEEHQDAAFESVGLVELVLGHGTGQELTWTLQMERPGELAPEEG